MLTTGRGPDAQSVTPVQQWHQACVMVGSTSIPPASLREPDQAGLRCCTVKELYLMPHLAGGNLPHYQVNKDMVQGLG